MYIEFGCLWASCVISFEKKVFFLPFSNDRPKMKREQDSDQEETSRSWWFMLLHPIELYDALIESWQTCNFDEVGYANSLHIPLAAVGQPADLYNLAGLH